MKPKRLPRLWCAMQGLLPVEACLAVQEAELAWPRALVAEAVPARLAAKSVPPAQSARAADWRCGEAERS